MPVELFRRCSHRTPGGMMNGGIRQFLLALILWAGLHGPLAAQSSDPIGPLEEVVLTDGSRLLGHAIRETPDSLEVETGAGTRFSLAKTQVRIRRPARGRVVDGVFWGEDPNATRLFFGPTARPLRRGEGYVSSYMILFPFVAYGVSDRLTLAGGTPIVPFMMGQVVYIAPKLTLYQGARLTLATGALSLFALAELDEENAGVVYGVGTVGTSERAVTGGVGWGYTWGDESGVSNSPVLMFGGETRLSPRVKLITENWVFAGGGTALLTGGIRFIGDRLSADLGVGGLTEEGSCCIPLVNFVYNFGR